MIYCEIFKKVGEVKWQDEEMMTRSRKMKSQTRDQRKNAAHFTTVFQSPLNRNPQTLMGEEGSCFVINPKI